jgi:Methylase of polypeptide chain release factors
MSILVGETGWERKDLDAYWTEPWCVEWLLAAMGELTSKKNVVWEPACGNGQMAEVLRKHGYDVLATDVKDYGYQHMQGVQDFLSVEYVDPVIDVIITNPPYEIKGVEGVPDVTAESFIRHALRLMEPIGGKVIMLLRNEFDSASSRVDLFDGYPFVCKYVLTRRPRWVEKQKGDPSPRHNYSWFVWDWGMPESTTAVIRYLRKPKVESPA